MLGRWNWNSRRKSAPVPFCPQISCDLSRARTQVDAMGSRLSCTPPINHFCRYCCINLWRRKVMLLPVTFSGVAVFWKKQIKSLYLMNHLWHIFLTLQGIGIVSFMFLCYIDIWYAIYSAPPREDVGLKQERNSWNLPLTPFWTWRQVTLMTYNGPMPIRHEYVAYTG